MTVTTHDVERYADVDLYGVLHLTAQAGPELIDRAYRLRAQAVHPDHAGMPSTTTAALVNAAGAILREPEARARYDALRTAWRAKHHARERTAEPRRARHPSARQARWLWVSGVSGAIIGALALSLVLGLAGSRQVRAAPAMLPLVVPASAAAMASPGAEAEWPAVLHDLDLTWEQDWPATIRRLDGFLERWPGYPAAEDKLYAALVADAETHRQAGQVAAAVAELERAARLLPGRGEAWAALMQLATADHGDADARQR